MTSALRGKVVLITGAARGIGAETARQAVARGARVALIGMEPERLAALAGELGPANVWEACDVTDHGSLSRAVREVASALGGVDVVVANAGIANRGTVSVSPIEAQARVIAVNLLGVMHTVHATLPYLIERKGHVVLISSAAAFTALPGMAPYAASKAGVEQYGNVLRLEVAGHGVTVGLVHPAWIDTDLVRDTQQDLPSFVNALRRLPGPFGRVTDVATCAAAIVNGMERRSRRVYVPGSLRWLAAIRSVFSSTLAERIMLRSASEHIGRSEDEVRATGRHFGGNSVGLGDGNLK